MQCLCAYLEPTHETHESDKDTKLSTGAEHPHSPLVKGPVSGSVTTDSQLKLDSLHLSRGESGTHRRGPCVLKRRSEFGKAFPHSPSEAHQGTLPVSPSPADHQVDSVMSTDTLQRAHPGGSSEAPQVFTGKCPLRERQSISLPAPPPPPFGYPVCTD
ncbi:hypothetical protein F7725_025651 [Dissostichus mawsoni]|uniref:Uncharacterized protein n=1 Tax=Dissostichus mawsoni TaxID=36200 RepID=A0A7J5XD05_DISMA|nr:hypothetical protein F7725_025651 [Dissostichus mawsoni]